MSSPNVLSEKDVNSTLANPAGALAKDNNAKDNGKAEIKSLEYHRQMLKSKMEQERYNNNSSSNNNNNSNKQQLPGAASITSPKHTNTSTSTNPSPTSPSTNTTNAGAFGSIVAQKRKLLADPRASLAAAHSGEPKYISPSDTIMSPCTAKLTALKGRHAEKAKPKSLFAQASAKKFAGENVFGARNAGSSSSSSSKSKNKNKNDDKNNDGEDGEDDAQ
ncbi:hypothetical protein GGR50DRAFT_645270 [Xylaria sp. CBS 124048]|nr:hypothetical protein GGR50DRAFT_645270 [Xylaria sp. CBS 124048]